MAVWAKIMTSLRDHKKANRAGDRAMWLYICMILFCKERDTYGRVSGDELNTLNAQRGKLALTKRLVACELLAETDDGWEVVDYIEKQGAEASASEKRARDAKRQRRKREADVTRDTVALVTPLEQSRVEQKDIDISLGSNSSPVDPDIEDAWAS